MCRHAIIIYGQSDGYLKYVMFIVVSRKLAYKKNVYFLICDVGTQKNTVHLLHLNFLKLLFIIFCDKNLRNIFYCVKHTQKNSTYEICALKKINSNIEADKNVVEFKNFIIFSLLIKNHSNLWCNGNICAFKLLKAFKELFSMRLFINSKCV